MHNINNPSSVWAKQVHTQFWHRFSASQRRTNLINLLGAPLIIIAYTYTCFYIWTRYSAGRHTPDRLVSLYRPKSCHNRDNTWPESNSVLGSRVTLRIDFGARFDSGCCFTLCALWLYCRTRQHYRIHNLSQRGWRDRGLSLRPSPGQSFSRKRKNTNLFW